MCLFSENITTTSHTFWVFPVKNHEKQGELMVRSLYQIGPLIYQSILSTNIPWATPGVLHFTAAQGPGFILDDLPHGLGFCISIHSHTCENRSIKEALYKSMLTAKAFQDTRHKSLTAKEQCGMKISYLQKSIGLVFIAISSGIKSFGTLL